MITFDEIVAAKERIKEQVYVTPLEFSTYLSNASMEVYLKLECQQRLKSFKIRGALNKIYSLSEEERALGIMAISSGNHGAAVSYTSSILKGLKAKVFVPATTPKPKVEKIKYYGADVMLVGNNYDEAHAIAMDYLEKEGVTFIDPCSDVQVIAGQGTIGLEIMEQNSDIDVILVPIGGGGMITGIGIAAKQLKPSVEVIGVQTEACPAMVHSLRDNICYLKYPTESSLCDALVGGVGKIPYQMAPQVIDDIIQVKEETIKKALQSLIIKEGIIAEPSSAVGVAALMEDPGRFENKKVAVVISGGNLDRKLMKQLIAEEE